MKVLTILRHAKSSWDDSGAEDFDRPLATRGWKAARRIGKEMKKRKMRFDCGLASPAARVRETIDGLIQGYGQPNFPIRFEPQVYAASTDTLLALVRALPADAERALLIGHNPGLERLVGELTRADKDGPRAKAVEKFPTAALAVIEMPAKAWAEVEPGSGELVELILPRELD